MIVVTKQPRNLPNMKLLIVIGACILAVKAEVTETNCDVGFVIDGKYYDKQVLKTGMNRPFLLTVDQKTDTLYFNHIMNTNEYKSVSLDLETNESRDIEGIPNSFSHAVDSDNNLLYVGTKDGIYVYNYNTKKSEFYGARGHYIWALFFEDNVLYYSEYPSKDLYAFSNGESTRFKELQNTKVHFFVLNHDNEIFFSNSTGLYKYLRESGESLLYKRFTRSWELRALTVDLYGNVYAAMENGIYSVKRYYADVSQVLSVPQTFGLAFDSNNNIIYSNKTSVLRLVPNNDKNC